MKCSIFILYVQKTVGEALKFYFTINKVLKSKFSFVRFFCYFTLCTLDVKTLRNLIKDIFLKLVSPWRIWYERFKILCIFATPRFQQVQTFVWKFKFCIFWLNGWQNDNFRNLYFIFYFEIREFFNKWLFRPRYTNKNKICTIWRSKHIRTHLT